MDFDGIAFKRHEGGNKKREVYFFGLSTCGFCKSALNFLNDNSIEYKYIFMDELELEIKISIKESFKKEYGKRLLYPTAIIERNVVLSGFIKPAWENALGTNPEKNEN